MKLLFHVAGGNNKDSHQWPPSNRNITLKNHIQSKHDAEINVRDFIEYISEKANLEKAITDPLFCNYEDLLRQMAEAEEHNKVADIPGWKQVTKIVPQSEKMMELIGEVMDDDAVRS